MPQAQKVYLKIMKGQADNNIDFDDLRYLLIYFGFRERIKGDHHFFSKTGISERVNIQPHGNKAKSYQVRQIREIILKYNMEVFYD